MKRASYSRTLAESLRKAFAAKKLELLRKAAFEVKTKAQVIRLLERKYNRQTSEFLRAGPETTYGDWLKYGPRDELEEVREAIERDHVWDHLIDRVLSEIRRAS